MAEKKQNHKIIDAILEADVEEPSNIESIVPALHDNYEAKYDVKTEKPWHRSFAYMLLQGCSIVECAEHFQMTHQHLQQVKKQEWFKVLTTKLAAAHFEDDVIGLLKSSAVTAITTLDELATSAESETVRGNAANNLLDKFLRHQPPPPPPTVDDPVQEARMLDEEIAQLEEEEQRHEMVQDSKDISSTKE